MLFRSTVTPVPHFVRTAASHPFPHFATGPLAAYMHACSVAVDDRDIAAGMSISGALPSRAAVCQMKVNRVSALLFLRFNLLTKIAVGDILMT